MDLGKNKNQALLNIKAATWYKDSHSLFDYESTKINVVPFQIPLTAKKFNSLPKEAMQICGNSAANVVIFDDNEGHKLDSEEYQLLTKFQIKPQHLNNKIKLEFFPGKQPKLKKINSERLDTDQSISSYCNKEEQTYLIVRKIKDINNEQKGYKLVPGQTIKLGRVQYFVSEVRQGGTTFTADSVSIQTHNYSNRKIFKYDSTQEKEKNACKICLEEVESHKNFLFNPCKCSGSCGTVHFNCLAEWIHFKVKKQVIGGTLHFNFNKFQCEVCKFEFPMIIETQGEFKQLLPIQKPKGNYIILEGACEKVKSVMMIQNVPSDGIKLGRGHDCEIRITDISVSRNHAYIKNVGNSFYVFDSKSKFGTLVKEDNMQLEIGRSTRSVQIGRTTLNFQMKRQSSQSQIQTSTNFKEPFRNDLGMMKYHNHHGQR